LFVSSIAIAVGSSLLTALFVRSLGVFQDVQRHDRELDAINEDLRRWVRDADWERSLILGEILSRERSGGPRELATTAERFRERWRNEASRALRDFWKVVDEEGRLHDLVRRKGSHWPELSLPHDVVELLSAWREPNVGTLDMYATVRRDPAEDSLEPDVGRLEEGAPLEFPRRSLWRGVALDAP
jgi:hypothetical protein